MGNVILVVFDVCDFAAHILNLLYSNLIVSLLAIDISLEFISDLFKFRNSFADFFGVDVPVMRGLLDISNLWSLNIGFEVWIVCVNDIFLGLDLGANLSACLTLRLRFVYYGIDIIFVILDPFLSFWDLLCIVGFSFLISTDSFRQVFDSVLIDMLCLLMLPRPSELSLSIRLSVYDFSIRIFSFQVFSQTLL